MQDKIIDLRQGKKKGRQWFDIKRAISFSIGEKRKRSKLIKLLNKITLAVMAAAVVIVGLRFLLQNKPKTVVFYDLLPNNVLSFSLINRNLTTNTRVIGAVLDGIGIYDEFFTSINSELDIESKRILESAKINIENEILPYLGDNVGIVTTRTNDKDSFILFAELKGSLKDVWYTKSKIEKELQATYNVIYTTYKGVSIVSISNFSSEMGFSWLNGHYAFVDRYFVLSDSIDNIKNVIDKNY